MLNLQKVASNIAEAKVKKRNISLEEAMKEAIEDASNHPAAKEFRVILDLSYDQTEPRQIMENFAMILSGANGLFNNKADTSGWEKLKAFEERKNRKN